MPFEKHRMKLVQLIDDLLELFETDPEFAGFFLDGQTIVLDDYLEIRPQNRDRLIRYIREGRLSAGPWYILQDEFLVSAESSVRNLLVGMREAEQYGRVSRIGYFPDAFGNAGQMPQLLRQAGIGVVFFGRGVKPIGFNNEVDESAGYESVFSEMQWSSPDGSALFAVLFANWYCNGMEVPAGEDAARAYWEDRIPKAERYASTGNLLFLNGCDHQPVQKDLSAAIRTANKLFPEVAFKHSSYEEFVRDVEAGQKNQLSQVEGELTSQETDGWMTLVNTCSAHIHLKRLNQQNQAALERLAEPLSAAACALDEGFAYPADLLRYAWKKLMQNHPHDSICGCSVDQVNREILARFEKSLAVGEELFRGAAERIAARLDTARFGGESRPFAVFNTSGWKRTGVVSVDLDIERDYKSGLTPAHGKMEALDVSGWTLVDDAGRSIPCTLADRGVRFGYDLPDDRFRQPYMARTLRVTFEAEDVPALGCRCFALVKGAAAEGKSLVTGENRMENGALAVAVNPDGTLDVTVKATGRTYAGMCAYEDTGDIGNEYIYFQPVGSGAITTRGLPAEITLTEDTPCRATYRIAQVLRVPEGADETLKREQERMIEFRERKAQRSERLIDLPVVTYVSLERQGRGVRIRSEFTNTARDHRLRMLFPTALAAQDHLADSIFEAVRRPNRPSACWQNPSNCQHQQSWVSLSDGENGVTVANLGLNEYEVLPDQENTIAVTLLRAVGEMGDWGVFPTPQAQCLGEGCAELELIPHAGDVLQSGAFAQAYQLQAPMVCVQTGAHPGAAPSGASFLSWEGETLALSALKQQDDSGDVIVRWFNLSQEPCELTVRPGFPAERAYRSNVVEEKCGELPADGAGAYRVMAGPAEIVTLRFSRSH